MTAAPPFALAPKAAPAKPATNGAVPRQSSLRLAIVDRSVLALTLLTAASLLLGAHGGHPSAPRDLDASVPIVIVTGVR